MDMIYCAAGNRKYLPIAVEAGFRYGARLPHTIYPEIAPLFFADQDWRRPNRPRYMATLQVHRPVCATVMDWERPEQRTKVLAWAEEAAQWVERVLIIPKAHGIIDQIPRTVGGKPVVLAYSVPTTYGGTPIHPEKFAGWPVHILGGTPEWQMRYWRYWQYPSTAATVLSVDGNSAQSMARRCQFWQACPDPHYHNPRWPQLQEVGSGWKGPDACYEAFRRSCANIAAAWRGLLLNR